MNDLISVIVPIYNVEPYLVRCVESILRQTHTRLEVILVDDGSEDDCGQICDDYALKDQRVKVIHKSNGGLADARNAGMEIAEGDYISHIDADDWISADMYSSLLKSMKDNDADIVECQYVVAESTSAGDRPCSGCFQEFTFDPEHAVKELILEGRLKTVVWNKLYRRSVIQDIKFQYGKYSEDVFWTYLAFCNAKAIIYLEKPMYFYFQRDESQMHEPFSIKKLDALVGQKERLDYIKDKRPALFNLAEIRYFLFSLYNYELLLEHKQCDPEGLYRHNIWLWVRENSFRLMRNPEIGKYRPLVAFFSIHPRWACRIRKRMQRYRVPG